MRLYRWEAAHVLPHAKKLLTLGECREIVATVFSARLGPAAALPRVEDGRGRRHAAGSREVIKLPRWARTRAIVLHECGHGLATDGHGPDYVRVYIELLVDFLQLERATLEASAKLAGLKISPRDKLMAVPAAPPPRRAAARVPRTLASRLLSIGIRTLQDLRAMGPVRAWVRLRQKFGTVIAQDSVVTLAALERDLPAADLDGRTRAQLKFDATIQLAEANKVPS